MVITLFFYAWSLTFDLKTISDMPQRSAVYDKDGKFYSRLAGENRVVVPFDKISNDFVNALLAREDTRFYYHHGIDPIGIARAVVRNFVAGGFREGASTLTQQLARNSFPLGGKNLIRKMIEAALAHRIETELTKEEILEAYMNRIYFGSGYYGVETASQAYFGKPASLMNLPEAAMLAGLIRSPNRFSPFNNLKKAVRERNAVLERMRKLDFISEKQMASRHGLHAEDRAEASCIASGQLGDGFHSPRARARDRPRPVRQWRIKNLHDDRRRAAERRRRKPSAPASANRIAARISSQADEGLFVRRPAKAKMPRRIWRALRSRSTATPAESGPLPGDGTTTAASSIALCWAAGRSALR